MLLLTLLLAHACVVAEEDYQSDYLYYDVCYASDPYYTSPIACQELAFQDALCCTWHVGYTCYEEWCIWADICQWEYMSYECDW